ncbi:hypothetical protein DL770_008373 [Monosporascus sp. CRB-9-2]|nr:hypothetical protein DL770_008373 [Monosporascus sp. CRB-9-2]
MSGTVRTCPELRRKFGKYDFERFDHISSLQASIGGGEIGKVKVDCRFQFKKSQWGVLGPKRHPAGIIYLDLNFHQPADCRLKSATVTVTLDDGTGDVSSKHRHSGRQPYAPNIPAQITPWYGPKQLSGQPRRILKTKRSNMTPFIEAMGMVGAGGIGRDSEETFVQESRWTFAGQLLPGEKTSAYTTIQWELTENELESQPTHSSVIHTAFAFEHEGQPFLMRVGVSGKLKCMNDRMKHQFKKFPSSLTKDGRYATTLVNFGGRCTFLKPLDELARGLAFAMEKENVEEAPVVIPDHQEVAFQDDKPTGEAPKMVQKDYDAHLGALGRPTLDAQHQTELLTRRMQPALEQQPSALAQLLSEQGLDNSTSDPTASTPTNLARTFAELTTHTPTLPVPRDPPRPTNRVMSEADDNTSKTVSVMDSYRDTDKIGSDLVKDGPDKRGLSKPQADLEAVMTLLQMSGLLSVMQVLVTLLVSCGVKLSPKKGSAENEIGTDKKIENGFAEESKRRIIDR